MASNSTFDEFCISVLILRVFQNGGKYCRLQSSWYVPLRELANVYLPFAATIEYPA